MTGPLGPRVVVGACGARMNAACGGFPPLVPVGTTFPPQAGALWVLSMVLLESIGKHREAYSAPCIGVASERDLQGSDSDPKIT